MKTLFAISAIAPVVAEAYHPKFVYTFIVLHQVAINLYQ